MSAYEMNWETGALVTAEAVSGIGFPPKGEPVGEALKEEDYTQDEAAD